MNDRPDSSPCAGNAASPLFATTHWTVVLSAGSELHSPDARQALETLCHTYWYPLYAFVRRQGKNAEDAQDVTQELFARLLTKGSIGLADPARGRFSSFLLTSLRNFLAEDFRRGGRLKRGGGSAPVSWESLTAEERYRAEPKNEASADRLYERRWALTLIESTLARLESELAAAGKERTFSELKGHLLGDPDAPTA